MDSVYFVTLALVGLFLSLLPCWAILSLPNLWPNRFPYLPAKRFSLVCLVLSFTAAYTFNIELEGGILTAFIFNTAFCVVLALAAVISLTLYIVIRKIFCSRLNTGD